MDINTLRGLVTAAALASFLGVSWWAFSSRNKRRFEQDALIPFADEAPTEPRVESPGND